MYLEEPDACNGWERSCPNIGEDPVDLFEGSKNGLVLVYSESNYVFDREESLLYSWDEMVLQGH